MCMWFLLLSVVSGSCHHHRNPTSPVSAQLPGAAQSSETFANANGRNHHGRLQIYISLRNVSVEIKTYNREFMFILNLLALHSGTACGFRFIKQFHIIILHCYVSCQTLLTSGDLGNQLICSNSHTFLVRSIKNTVFLLVKKTRGKNNESVQYSIPS